MPPILLNGLRWSLTGILMFWFFPFPKKILKRLILISIFFSIQYSLTYSALNIIDASSASFFIQSEVPFGLLAAFLLLGEKLSFKNFIGLIIASIGIIFLTGNPNLEGKLFGVMHFTIRNLYMVFCASTCKTS